MVNICRSRPNSAQARIISAQIRACRSGPQRGRIRFRLNFGGFRAKFGRTRSSKAQRRSRSARCWSAPGKKWPSFDRNRGWEFSGPLVVPIQSGETSEACFHRSDPTDRAHLTLAGRGSRPGPCPGGDWPPCSLSCAAPSTSIYSLPPSIATTEFAPNSSGWPNSAKHGIFRPEVARVGQTTACAPRINKHRPPSGTMIGQLGGFIRDTRRAPNKYLVQHMLNMAGSRELVCLSAT